MKSGKIKPVILLVDDERGAIEANTALLDGDYDVISAENGSDAVDIARSRTVDIVLLDMLLPDMDGVKVLEKMRKICDAEIIVISAVKMMKTAVRAVKAGAYDYLTKPFEADDLLDTIEKALEKRKLEKEVIYLKSELKPELSERMVGNSPAMKQLFSVIAEISDNRSTVLITGESGTGKELIARAIHFSGACKDKPFVAVDAASIPENLVESELFGHEKGSFTDAVSKKIGKFELANTGTLFFDEIGNLSYEIQGKILRAIEEKEIQRVGGEKLIKTDVRIVSATNADLKKAVKDGSFRHDLYYRLNVIPVHAPPLRERIGDIPLLIDHFIHIYSRKFGKDIRGISKEALEAMTAYHWPGNIRELRNIIERLVALGKEQVIQRGRLPMDMLLKEEKPESSGERISLKNARNDFEKQFILGILEKAGWNQTKAAQILGIHRNALLYKMNQLGVQKQEKHASNEPQED
ncbi:MAG: sigma-54 dependent transcriptional regulator [Elusimicrobiota bacterium]